MLRLKEIYKMYFFMYLCLTNNNLRVPIERKGLTYLPHLIDIPSLEYEIALTQDDFVNDAWDSKCKIDYVMENTEIEADPASFSNDLDYGIIMGSGHAKSKLILSGDIVCEVNNVDWLKTGIDEAKAGFMRATNLPKVMITAMYTGMSILRNTAQFPDVIINSIRAFGNFEKHNMNDAQIAAFDYEEESSLSKATTNEDQWMDMDFVDRAIAAELRTQWRHFRRNSA